MKISQVLEGIADWEGLAGWLNLNRGAVDDIKSDCRLGSSSIASCYRKKMVEYYCDMQVYDSSTKVAEDIAEVLDSVNKKRYAEKLRRLFDLSKSLTM